MNRRETRPLEGEMDSLRLIALGRIPRCTHCPRYRALSLMERAGHPAVDRLPPIPENCTWQVCAPLVRRYERAAPGDDDRIRYAS